MIVSVFGLELFGGGIAIGIYYCCDETIAIPTMQRAAPANVRALGRVP
jgi:hypothetical protein